MEFLTLKNNILFILMHHEVLLLKDFRGYDQSTTATYNDCMTLHKKTGSLELPVKFL